MKHISTIGSGLAGLALLCAAPAPAQQTVSEPHFDSIELEGGGHVMVTHGSVQQVMLISGSTHFTRFRVEEGRTLRIDACRENCPYHYDLGIKIATPHLDSLAVSGGGTIQAAGNFPLPARLALAVEGGGTVDARALNAGDVTATVDGGGAIRLRAGRKLTATINGGGRIRYWGNPRVTEAIDGGGTVEHGD